jgi:hypothetical protein
MCEWIGLVCQCRRPHPRDDVIWSCGREKEREGGRITARVEREVKKRRSAKSTRIEQGLKKEKRREVKRRQEKRREEISPSLAEQPQQLEVPS